MAIGDSAGILFKIRSQYDDKGVRQAKGDITDLGAAGTLAGGGLASMINPAALVAAGLTAVVTAAVAAAAGIVRLTISAAEFGSEIFDASQKTGLGAETLTALKFAAEQSGSSFEQVTKGISVFGVTLGEAALGSTKAQEKLDELGVTSADLDTALQEVFKTINEGATDTEKLALAATAFGKKIGPDLIPLIKEADGNLNKLKQTASALGVTLTDEDIAAADKFGDTMGVLGTQAEMLGYKFASELMPLMTGAMSQISQALSENQGVAREWGQALVTTAEGVSLSYNALSIGINQYLDYISFGLASNLQQTSIWAAGVKALILGVLGPLGLMFQIGETLGSKNVGAGMGGGANVPSAIKLPGGGAPGGGGGGGGGGGKAKAGPSEFDTASKESQRRLAAYKAGLEVEEAALKQSLNNKLLSELDYTKQVNELKVAAVMFELELNKTLLKNTKMTADQKVELENKKLILEKKLAAERIKLGNAVFEEIQDLVDKENDAFEKATKEYEEKEKRRRKAQRETANERARREISDSQKEAKKLQSDMNLSILGDSPLILRDQFGDIENMISPVLPMLQLAGQAINQLAQGVGSLVQEWVLMGSVGPNAMKKMVASVLAGVAAQAAVLSVMELAYGIAALTPWGFAIYGSPVPHFKAAALFAGVAAVAGGAGRAIAGNSFSGEAGSAGGGAGGADSDQGNKPTLVFTEKFDGFTKQLAVMNDRQNLMLGHVGDAVDRFNEKFGVTTPDAVVMAGASGAAESIFNANQKVMQEDPWAPTQQRRNQGDYR